MVWASVRPHLTQRNIIIEMYSISDHRPTLKTIYQVNVTYCGRSKDTHVQPIMQKVEFNRGQSNNLHVMMIKAKGCKTFNAHLTCAGCRSSAAFKGKSDDGDESASNF